jgi:hypothetical protein
VLLSFWTNSHADAEAEDLWAQLETASEKCFKKAYYVIVKAATGEKIKVFVDVSKETKEKRKAYIEAVEELIKEVELIIAELEVKERMAEVLKQAMIQEGMTGINKYFDIEKEIATLKVKKDSALRKFNRLIVECEVDTQEKDKIKDEIANTGLIDLKE